MVNWDSSDVYVHVTRPRDTSTSTPVQISIFRIRSLVIADTDENGNVDENVHVSRGRGRKRHSCPLDEPAGFLAGGQTVAQGEAQAKPWGSCRPLIKQARRVLAGDRLCRNRNGHEKDQSWILTQNRQDYSERMESRQSKLRRSRLSPAKRRRAPHVEVDYCPRASLRSPWATVCRPPKAGGLCARSVAARFGLN